MNNQLKEYLQASAGERHVVLKQQYMASIPRGLSGRELAMFHLKNLVEYTQRLSMIEWRSKSGPIIKASDVRNNDLFMCVEISVAAIEENVFLKSKNEFQLVWQAFTKLLACVKTRLGPTEFIDSSFLLFYIASIVLERYIIDQTTGKAPPILSVARYSTIAASWAYPLFEDGISLSDQFRNLSNNLNKMNST